MHLRRLGIASVLVLPVILCGVTTASAAEAPSPGAPDDVVALLAGPAVAQVQAAAAEASAQQHTAKSKAVSASAIGSDAPDFSGDLTAGPAHQVYGFSEEFTSGAKTSTPVTPTAEWIAALMRDGTPVGTVRVWKPEGAPAELAEYTSDSALGTALVKGTYPVVEDGTISAYYRLDGKTLKPLASAGQVEFTGPVGIDQAQAVISSRITKAASQAAIMNDAAKGRDRSIGGTAIVQTEPRSDSAGLQTLGAGLALAGAAGLAVVFAARRRAALRNHI